MSEPGKAIFLSYASQDVEAARRIADALRAAGIEVWFDQSELRGGDAWDQKIRKQIKECALFVPVISANTQARREGYFRIEWKLAAQRTHAIAEGTPFVVPILLGDVVEAEALVPSEFREVQWTRLRLEETPTTLASRIAALLRGDADVAGRPVAPAAGGQLPRPRPARWVRWITIAAAAGALLLGTRPFWQSQPPDDPFAEERLAGLLGKAREQTAIAEESMRRAVEKEPGSARAWSARAFVQSVYLIRGWDTGDKRR